jgi:hypothetical protein
MRFESSPSCTIKSGSSCWVRLLDMTLEVREHRTITLLFNVKGYSTRFQGQLVLDSKYKSLITESQFFWVIDVLKDKAMSSNHSLLIERWRGKEILAFSKAFHWILNPQFNSLMSDEVNDHKSRLSWQDNITDTNKPSSNHRWILWFLVFFPSHFLFLRNIEASLWVCPIKWPTSLAIMTILSLSLSKL